MFWLKLIGIIYAASASILLVRNIGWISIELIFASKEEKEGMTLKEAFVELLMLILWSLYVSLFMTALATPLVILYLSVTGIVAVPWWLIYPVMVLITSLLSARCLSDYDGIRLLAFLKCHITRNPTHLLSDMKIRHQKLKERYASIVEEEAKNPERYATFLDSDWGKEFFIKNKKYSIDDFEIKYLEASEHYLKANKRTFIIWVVLMPFLWPVTSSLLLIFLILIGGMIPIM